MGVQINGSEGNVIATKGTFSGDVGIGGTLTYEDVTNVDSVGLITARAGVVVGSGITLSKDGDGFFTGVTTATTFVGALTGNVTGNISGGTVAGSTGTFSGAISGTTGTFTGDVTVSSANLTLGDSNGSNNVIVLGASNDLQISHVSNVSKIRGVTTNDIHIESAADFKIKHTDTDGSNAEDMIVCTGDAAVELYHDNSKKLSTLASGIKVERTDATNSYITLATSDGDCGFLYANSNTDIQLMDREGHPFLKGIKDGAIELYYDNSKKFETVSYGAAVSGIFTSTGDIKTMNDTAKFVSGASDDLQIYHDGTNSHIYNSTNELKIRSNDVRLQNAAGSENYFVGFSNSYSAMYYDNSKKLETSDGGIDISGWVRPTVDDYWDIGHPSYRWDDIRATNTSIVASDKNEKNTIVDSDLGLSFVNKLKPVSYKFNGKTRTHYGLIAQDVETVITDLGKTTTQFAPLIKDTLEDGTERYGLRYGELIAPLIKAVQELSAKNDALASEIEQLKSQLNN